MFEKPMGGVISAIEPDSIAEDLGWRPGDEIISINDHNLSDVIDFRFYCADESLSIVIKRGSRHIRFDIEKDEDLPLGVEFKDVLFDGVRTCGAHCIFCFVEQLPRGLRKSLYLKDDDYRLSFLDGNFVTLANVTETDLDRIVTQRLTPLYVSVHATDPDLRKIILGRDIPDILHQIGRLSEGRITLNTQVVLCRGINDGAYLDRTIEDLSSRYPTVSSIAIVPVGISKHRRHTMRIQPIGAQYSAEILYKVKQWQHKFLNEKGTRLVWAADEFYLSAGRPVSGASAYEGFPQIENGIGLVRRFKDSAARARQILPASVPRPLHVSIVTGRSAAPIVKKWAESLRCENLSIQVFPITNRLFGEMVTVTGLIAGNDIIAQLKGCELGDILFVPAVSLRDGAFLDDVTIDDLRDTFGMPVEPVEPGPYRLVRRIIKLTLSSWGTA
jgi:putative radical SAM enzyme (TIGR03279 family)